MDVYINYPQPHVTIHCDPACGLIKQHHKPNRREMRITMANLEDALGRFRRQEIPFAATAANNDLWIHLDLGSPSDEEAIVYQIQALLGARYQPLRERARVKRCPFCCRQGK